jgi:hypothetical protein
MYCNINEAFGGNSNYIKSYLDNEINNQKLLEKYKNFDNFFSKEEKETHQRYPNNLNIIEHFDQTTPTITTQKPDTSNMICDRSLEHVIKCSNCKKRLIQLYIKDLFNNATLENQQFKNLISIGLIVILFIVVIKLLWKL